MAWVLAIIYEYVARRVESHNIPDHTIPSQHSHLANSEKFLETKETRSSTWAGIFLLKAFEKEKACFRKNLEVKFFCIVFESRSKPKHD
jgi:hypothetical protein